MTNIQSLMDLIKAATSTSAGTVNITINMGATDVPLVEDDEDTVAVDTPETDFEVGERVLVCHIRKDGSRVHTTGVVDTVLGYDEDGYYTRVTGDNGKHYRTGVVYNQERKGSMIVELED